MAGNGWGEPRSPDSSGVQMSIHSIARDFTIKSIMQKTIEQSKMTLWSCDPNGIIDILSAPDNCLLRNMLADKDPGLTRLKAKIRSTRELPKDSGSFIWTYEGKLFLINYTKLKNPLNEVSRIAGFVTPIES